MHALAVCGSGYVGLVTAACLAQLGNDVIAYDTDLTKIALLRSGEVPFHEPELRDIVARESHNGHLRFTSSAREALEGRSIVFIAVGTPVGPLGDADLTYVRQAARDIAKHADDGLLVVNKSTVPVETSDLVARLLEREAPERRFRVVSNPEFLREGSAVSDFMHPDRIVIGTRDATSASLLRDLYTRLDAPVLVVDPHTAEMIKYAANAFLATKISFINELSSLCDAVGADIDGVLRGIAYDHRIGKQYMQPGIGFGGSCLPKDVSALRHVAKTHAMDAKLLDAVLDVNHSAIVNALQRVVRACGDLDGTTAAVWGLAFKPMTDDVRESPSVAFVQALLSLGARVCVHDPAAMGTARAVLGDRVTYAASPYEAAQGADYLVLATPWPVYQTVAWRDVQQRMRAPRVFDVRNALDPAAMRALLFEYHGTGRPERFEAPV